MHVHTRYREHGGEDVAVDEEVRLLRQAGHQVMEYRVQNPVQVLPAVASLLGAPWNAAAARRAKQLADKCRADVAHVHNTWFAMSPSVISGLRASGLPVVLTLHNYRLVCINAQLLRDGLPCELCVGRGPWLGLRYRCYRDSYAQSAIAAATLAVNRRLRTWADDVSLFLILNTFARDILVRGGLPVDKIRIKPNFVPDPGERPRPPSASRTVLFVGRLSHEKGVGTLVEAWKRRKDKDLELVVVGQGPERHLFPGELPDVRVMGRVSRLEVQRLMSNARALVFPTRWYEGQPMALLEALASGVPVISSDLGGLPELFGPDGAFGMVDSPDPDAWAAAIDRLTNDAEVDLAGKRARSRYMEAFRPEQALQSLEAAYTEVLTGSTKGRH